MIYEIIRQKDNKTWYIENPAFVRQDDKFAYYLTNEPNADAVYIDGICYNILGRSPIQGLDIVMVGITGTEAYTNKEVKEKIDDNSSSIDELWIAVLEE